MVNVEKKAVQKTDSSIEDLEEKQTAHGNKNEHIEEVMNQKGIKLRELINQSISDDDSNKINQIIEKKKQSCTSIYRM